MKCTSRMQSEPGHGSVGGHTYRHAGVTELLLPPDLNLVLTERLNTSLQLSGDRSLPIHSAE